MKKLLSICLTLLLLCLLSSCAQPTETEHPTDSEVPTPAGTDSGTATENPLDFTQPFTAQSLDCPYNTEDFALVYYDNCDYDHYYDVAGSFQYRIYILSRTPIALERMSGRSIGTVTATVTFYDETDNLSWDKAHDTNWDFADYIYQSSQGMDWKQAGQLYIAYRAASAAAEANLNAQTNQEALDADKAFHDYMAQYIEEYNQTKKAYMEAGPYFYFYSAVFDLEMPKGAQTLEQVELTIDEKTYLLDIGQIRLHETSPESLQTSEIQGICDYALGGTQMVSPWNDGIVEVGLEFLADQDLTLKKLYSLDAQKAKIWHILVQRQTETGMSMESVWDGSSDLTIDQGERLTLFISLYLPEMAGAENYCGTVYLPLEFEAEGQSSVVPFYTSFLEERNPYELCAQYLDGIDIQSYYVDYYNIWQTYVREG